MKEYYAVMLGHHGSDPHATRIVSISNDPQDALKSARQSRECAKIWYSMAIEGRTIIDKR
jgi:hypothetical protein